MRYKIREFLEDSGFHILERDGGDPKYIIFLSPFNRKKSIIQFKDDDELEKWWEHLWRGEPPKSGDVQ